MSAKDAGGPAFPMGHTESAMYASCMEDLANPAIDDAERAHLWAKAKALCGLTRRDYFATHAPPPPSTWVAKRDPAENLIAWRIAYADAMLEALDAK